MTGRASFGGAFLNFTRMDDWIQAGPGSSPRLALEAVGDVRAPTFAARAKEDERVRK